MKFDYYAEYIYCIFISQISTKFCMFIFIDGIIKGKLLVWKPPPLAARRDEVCLSVWMPCKVEIILHVIVVVVVVVIVIR